MKLPAIATLIALAIAPAAAARPATCVPGTTTVASAQFARFNAAWATHDADKVTALFAPDAELLPTLSPVPRTDPAGIRDYFVGFLKGNPQARIVSAQSFGGCNWVVYAGQWAITLKDEAGTRDVHARYTFLFRRSGGQWRIAHLHSSLDPQAH